MKAENEDLKDEMLSKAINDGFKEEGISSNFTHQVMGKIEQLEKSPKSKSLLPWWGWILAIGPIVFSFIYAIIAMPYPEESTITISEDVSSTYSEYSQYAGFVLIAMAVILVDQIIKYKRKFY